MHPKRLNVIVELSPALLSGAAITETISKNNLSSVKSWDPVLEEKIRNEDFVSPQYRANTQAGMGFNSGAITDQLHNFEQVIFFNEDHYEYYARSYTKAWNLGST